ncbi:MAG: hypothetical protein CM15mP74_10730 [Halieaceae bacterium]|nr:MAG: hypothetical protein CM15mP74_10730 [Halieaceae bacterium]
MKICRVGGCRVRTVRSLADIGSALQEITGW